MDHALGLDILHAISQRGQMQCEGTEAKQEVLPKFPGRHHDVPGDARLGKLVEDRRPGDSLQEGAAVLAGGRFDG